MHVIFMLVALVKTLLICACAVILVFSSHDMGQTFLLDMFSLHAVE